MDSPSVRAEPTADIADVFAWMTSDGENLNLAMTVNPMAGDDAMFPTGIEYNFRIMNYADITAEPPDRSNSVSCSFYGPNLIECWVFSGPLDGPIEIVAYVAGDSSTDGGLVNTEGNVRVWAGLRNDPFFFNLGGLTQTIADVNAARSGLTFDAANCPAIDATTAVTPTGIADSLSHAADGSAAVDDLAGTNVLALVVQIDKDLVTGAGPYVKVMGNTNRHATN